MDILRTTEIQFSTTIAFGIGSTAMIHNKDSYMNSPTSPESFHSILYDHYDVVHVCDGIIQRLERTPECGLNDDLIDPDNHIDGAIKLLRSRGLTDAEIEKARRWNQPPMAAAQDAAQFRALVEASNSIGTAHSKNDLKEAYMRKDMERIRGTKLKYSGDHEQEEKAAKLLRELEDLKADVGTMDYCRQALQGGRTAHHAITCCVEMILKDIKNISKAHHQGRPIIRQGQSKIQKKPRRSARLAAKFSTVDT